MSKVTERQIVEFLDKYGFKHSLCGYRYAVEIIKVCAQNPELKKGIVKTYNQVAKSVGTTGTRFERGLRHSIERSDIPKMTNKEFIFSAIDSLMYGTSIPISSGIEING